MAQTESLTNETYAEMAKLMAGEAATEVQSMCCLKTACTANATQTSAGVTKCTESGLTIADADTVKTSKTTIDNDTVEADHKFTAAASAAVLGCGLWNNDDDQLLAICCYAATINMESSDTLSMEFKIQAKAD